MLFGCASAPLPLACFGGLSLSRALSLHTAAPYPFFSVGPSQEGPKGEGGTMASSSLSRKYIPLSKLTLFIYQHFSLGRGGGNSSVLRDASARVCPEICVRKYARINTGASVCVRVCVCTEGRTDHGDSLANTHRCKQARMHTHTHTETQEHTHVHTHRE